MNGIISRTSYYDAKTDVDIDTTNFIGPNAISTSPSANNRPLSSVKPDHYSNRIVAQVENEEEANFEVSPLSDSTGPPWGGKSHREHKELARNIRPRVLIVIGVSWRRPPSVNLVDSHSKLTARCILCLLLQAGIYRGRWVYFWLQIPS